MARATREVPLQDSRSVRGPFCTNSHVCRFLISNSGVNTINSYAGFELNFKLIFIERKQLSLNVIGTICFSTPNQNLMPPPGGGACRKWFRSSLALPSVGGLHFRSSIQQSIPTHTYIYKHLHFQASCSCCFPHSPQVKSWWGLVNWVWSLITEYPSFESCIQSPVTTFHSELFFNASQHSKWSVLLHSSALHL